MQGESKEEEEISEVVEYLDNHSILSTHKPMVVVKKEAIPMVNIHTLHSYSTFLQNFLTVHS